MIYLPVHFINSIFQFLETNISCYLGFHFVTNNSINYRELDIIILNN
jgi:hypothetical protein